MAASGPFRQLYRFVSAPISTELGRIDVKKKKKERRIGASDAASVQMRRPWSHTCAFLVKSHYKVITSI